MGLLLCQDVRAVQPLHQSEAGLLDTLNSMLEAVTLRKKVSFHTDKHLRFPKAEADDGDEYALGLREPTSALIDQLQRHQGCENVPHGDEQRANAADDNTVSLSEMSSWAVPDRLGEPSIVKIWGSVGRYVSSGDEKEDLLEIVGRGERCGVHRLVRVLSGGWTGLDENLVWHG